MCGIVGALDLSGRRNWSSREEFEYGTDFASHIEKFNPTFCIPGPDLSTPVHAAPSGSLVIGTFKPIVGSRVP